MNTRSYLYQTKKKKKWPWIIGLLFILLAGGGAFFAHQQGYLALNELFDEVPQEELIVEQQPEEEVEPEPIPEPEPEPEPEVDRSGAKGYEGNEVLPQEPTYMSGILMASKQYPLPQDFVPTDEMLQEVQQAFAELAAAASLDGYELVAFSGYRSFERQQELYERYVANDGQEEADRYSARPGHSEHQTGLALDIGEKNFEQHFARVSFGDTEAGKWLAENAHLYGFILRYPEGKEKITGYMYEPWHFRYLGKELALEIVNSGLTVEEYIEQ